MDKRQAHAKTHTTAALVRAADVTHDRNTGDDRSRRSVVRATCPNNDRDPRSDRERSPIEVSRVRPLDSNPKTRDCVEETRESWVGGKSSKRGSQAQSVPASLEPKWQRFVSTVGERCIYALATHTLRRLVFASQRC